MQKHSAYLLPLRCGLKDGPLNGGLSAPQIMQLDCKEADTGHRLLPLQSRRSHPKILVTVEGAKPSSVPMALTIDN